MRHVLCESVCCRYHVCVCGCVFGQCLSRHCQQPGCPGCRKALDTAFAVGSLPSNGYSSMCMCLQPTCGDAGQGVRRCGLMGCVACEASARSLVASRMSPWCMVCAHALRPQTLWLRAALPVASTQLADVILPVCRKGAKASALQL